MSQFKPAFSLPDGFQRIAAAAKLGEPYAEWLLGMMYLQGHDVERDLVVARALFERSATGGLSLAARALAFLYANGLGVAQDHEKSFAYERQAADLGHAEAQYQVGNASLMRTATKDDVERAKHYLSLAAFAGKKTAALALAVYDVLGTPLLTTPAYAYELLVRKSLADDAAAKYALGWFYLSGISQESADRKSALSCFEEAAAAGHVAAQRDLGRLLTAGDLGEVDAQSGTKWLYQAASAGDGWAATQLGRHIVSGLGTFADPVAAELWFARAEAAGFAGARLVRVDSMLGATADDVANDDVTRDAETALAAGFSLARSVLLKLHLCFPERFPVSESVLRWLSYGGLLSDSDAMVTLAGIYLDKGGAFYRPELGLFWLQAAVDERSTLAMQALAEELLKGDACAKDVASATSLLQNAAALGDAGAASRLAYEFNFNPGLVRNMWHGARVNEYAARQGQTTAQRNLSIQYFHGQGIQADRDLGQYWLDQHIKGQAEAAAAATTSSILMNDPFTRSREGKVLDFEVKTKKKGPR